MHAQNNLFLKKKLFFLGLMTKNKTPDVVNNPNDFNDFEIHIPATMYSQFIRIHIPLLSSMYISEYANFWKYKSFENYNITTLKLLYYYANFNKNIKNTNTTYEWNFFHSLRINNTLVFSKPKKQLFMVFFKSKPIFIFTGGLMRKVMNEKRKSGKKLYKVATSLIKLSAILLFKKNYFPTCYLTLKNVGILKSKILNTYVKTNTFSKIQYIFITFKLDFTSQKFSTRRSIKKFLKKKFTTR